MRYLAKGIGGCAVLAPTKNYLWTKEKDKLFFITDVRLNLFKRKAVGYIKSTTTLKTHSYNSSLLNNSQISEQQNDQLKSDLVWSFLNITVSLAHYQVNPSLKKSLFYMCLLRDLFIKVKHTWSEDYPLYLNPFKTENALYNKELSIPKYMAFNIIYNKRPMI